MKNATTPSRINSSSGNPKRKVMRKSIAQAPPDVHTNQSEVYNPMPGALLGRMLNQQSRQSIPVARQKPHAAEQPLLQMAVRIQVQHNSRRMLVQRGLL